MTRLLAGSWVPIAFGFMIYAIILVAAYFAHLPALLSLGALAMVFISSMGNYQRLFTIRVGPPVRWALLSIVPPTLGLIVNRDSSAIEPVLKYDLIFLVFLQIYSWRLSPLNRSPVRWALFGGCLALIFCSVLSGHYFEGDGGRRLAGIFQNPNNLALIGLALPFFLNDDDRRLRQALVHGAAIVTIALTGTLGAILGYAAGMAYRLRRMLTARLAAVGFVLVVLAAAVLLGKQGTSQLRLVRQYEVIQDSLSALQSDSVEFGEVVEAHGEDSTSALWRLTMWRAVLRAYAQGEPYQWAIGRGGGASYALFGILPHNEYLRLLLETGVLGLIAFLGLCWSAWRGMPHDDRYAIPMVLTYCFSENIFDNFMFMALFVFLIASTQPAVRATEQSPWDAPVRRSADRQRMPGVDDPVRGARRALP
jgi:O-antigen ligase